MKVSFQVARMWQTAKISPETFWGPRVCPGLTSYYPYYLVTFFLPFWTTGAGVVCWTSAIIRWLLQKLIYQLLLFIFLTVLITKSTLFIFFEFIYLSYQNLCQDQAKSNAPYTCLRDDSFVYRDCLCYRNYTDRQMLCVSITWGETACWRNAGKSYCFLKFPVPQKVQLKCWWLIALAL
jgi:hypothetical protein